MDLQQFTNKKYLNRGQCSKCYILPNGNVFKQFNNPLSISDIERFKYFLKYENESFLFPFDFVHDKKKFYGYITKKALGLTLRECFSVSDLENMAKNSQNLEENINYVSKGKIVMNDYHSENIMYNQKMFEVIDTDEYSIRDYATIEEVTDINMKNHRKLITNLFITNIKNNSHTKYILDRINIYKYSGMPASQIIIKIKEDMEKHYKESIETVDDFNEVIRKNIYCKKLSDTIRK